MQTMTLKVVTDAHIVIGKVFNVASFLVIGNLATYRFGWSWMLQYDVQLKPMLSKFAIGIPPNNRMTDEEKIPYQTKDLMFATKKMTLTVV